MYCTLSTWSYKYCLNEVIIHTPPRTILGFVEMSHFCGIFHFPQRHWNDAILKKNNSSSLSKGQMTHFQNINSLIALASGQTSWADNISNGFGMKLYICLDKREKNLTGVSGRCDVISKFNPAWDPPASYCVTSAPCGPCWHPWPLACWWLTGSPSTIFPKLTFSLLLPHTPSLRCSGFWETRAFYSFMSRRNTGMIYRVF